MDHFLSRKKQNDKNIEAFNIIILIQSFLEIRIDRNYYNRKMTDHKIKFSRIHSGWAIDHLMEKVEDRIFEKFSSRMYCGVIAKQIALTNKQSIQQIATVKPKKSNRIDEDFKPDRMRIVPDRPYSAKVKRNSQIFSDKGLEKITKGSDSKHLRLSNRKNIQSHRSIRSQGSKTMEQNKKILKNSVLIPLQINRQEQDIQDKVIERLRKQKLKTQEYQHKKQIFMRSISKQNQLYQKDQNKFYNAFSTKDHTYGLTGNLIEIPKKSNNTKLKKKTTNFHSIKTPGKKGDEQAIDNQALLVQYNATQSQCQKQEYVFDEELEQKKVFSKTNLVPSSTNENQSKKVMTKFTLIAQDL